MPAAPIEVMLVEDDPGDVVLVREALAHKRQLVTDLRVASDGVDALDQLRDEGRRLPDVVLLDLNLPRKDGLEVLEEIRSDPRLTSLPVVVLTTSEAHADIVRSYELHANAYITKPVGLEPFLEAVREIDRFFLGVVKLPGRP